MVLGGVTCFYFYLFLGKHQQGKVTPWSVLVPLALTFCCVVLKCF